MSLELKAKEILETGDIKTFEKFIIKTSDKINIGYLFNGRVSFPIILLQTYRSAESLGLDQSSKVVIDDYKHCLRFLVEMGCNLNVQDDMGKTFAHFTILMHCLEMLAIALELGCDPLVQDSEGETIVHLAIRHSDQMALETIKLYANNSEVFETPSDTSGATPLIYAVQIGAVDIVKKLLQLSVNVNGQENNQYKRTALHYALFTANEEIFTLLLKNKARADIKDYKDKCVIDRVVEHPTENFLRILTHFSSSEIFSNPSSNSDHIVGYSPFILASKNGDYSMLCHLIDKEMNQSKKIDLMVEDNELRTSLHHCADNPDTKCAEKLLELEPKLIGKKDKNGFTALHLATIANNKKLVQLLIKHGCDIKEKDNDGHTSLHWAVVCCATDLIDMFLKSDPEISYIVDDHGASPLHYATQSFLSPEGSTLGPVVVEKLLKNNKDCISGVDHDGRTPLLWAASLGITDCCQILLEEGANNNHRDNNGLSALHCAASRGHYDVVDLLVNTWSMMVDIVDKNLCTPLFYAVTLKHMPIIHFLVEQRSNPNHQDIKGRSVAHCAALKGYCEILDIIRNVGGSLTLKNNNDDLPLHEASETGKLEVCKVLLEKMIDTNEINQIDAINKCGFGALHNAAQNNYEKICQLLISYGANVNLLTNPNSRTKSGIDKSNLSPLDLATDLKTINMLKDLKGKSSKELTKKIAKENNQDPESKTHDDPITKNNIQPKERNDNRSNEGRGLKSFQNVDISENKDILSPKKFGTKTDPISQSSKFVRLSQSNKNTNTVNEASKYPSGSNSKNRPIGNKKDTDKSVATQKSTEKKTNPENIKTVDDSHMNKKFQKIEQPNKNAKNKANFNDNDIIKIVSTGYSTPENSSEAKKEISSKPVQKMSNKNNIILTSLNDSTDSENKRKYTATDTSKRIEQNYSNRHAAKVNPKIMIKVSTNDKPEENYSNGKENKKTETQKLVIKKVPKNKVPEKTVNMPIAEDTERQTHKSALSTGNVDIKIKLKAKPTKENVNSEWIGHEAEIPSTINANQTASANMNSYTYDNRKSNKSKPFDLFSKVVKSVKEYESVRDRMRSLSDQRRLGMFQGYSKAIKLDKIPTRAAVKPEKPKKATEHAPNYTELPELTVYDPDSVKRRNLFPMPQSKEEQIRQAYESQPSINTLTIYSNIP